MGRKGNEISISEMKTDEALKTDVPRNATRSRSSTVEAQRRACKMKKGMDESVLKQEAAPQGRVTHATTMLGAFALPSSLRKSAIVWIVFPLQSRKRTGLSISYELV